MPQIYALCATNGLHVVLQSPSCSIHGDTNHYRELRKDRLVNIIDM
jgi:hypothetical protein